MKKTLTILIIFILSNLTAQTNSNYDFETWTTVPANFPAPSYDNPTSWNSLNNLTSALGKITCYKETAPANVYSGLASVKLVTKTVGSQVANGLISTGTINPGTSSISGGVAYTLRPDSIIGWYKYSPVSTDNGFIELQLLGVGGDSDTIGYAIFRTPNAAVNTYTRFAVKIDYRSNNPVVKSIWILSSSANNTVHFENSTMYVDAIQLGSNVFAATTINEVVKPIVSVGPNPASENIQINNSPANGTFTLYSITGRSVKKVRLINSSQTIDVVDLAEGIYFYSITDKNNVVIKTAKLIIQR